MCNNSSLDESSSIYYYIRRKNGYLILYFHLLNSFFFQHVICRLFFALINSIKQKLGILLSNCVCIFFYCNFTCDYFYLIHFKYIEKIDHVSACLLTSFFAQKFFEIGNICTLKETCYKIDLLDWRF